VTGFKIWGYLANQWDSPGKSLLFQCFNRQLAAWTMMTHRILMIDADDEDYLYFKALLEKMDGQPFTLDWLREWDEVPDMEVFRQYDVILAVSAGGGGQKKPGFLRDMEWGDLKSRILSLASHEFRTPLTSIASSAELIEAYIKQEDYDKLGKHLARIKKSVNELDLILNRVLSHGQSETQKPKSPK